MVMGHYDPRLTMPLIPASDGVGEIVETGRAVKRFVVGERVAGTFVQGWVCGPFNQKTARKTLGGPLDGMLATEVVLPESGVISVPEHVTDDQAATLPCAGLTAWNAIFSVGKLKPGDSVLIQGTGGVSTFALQFAKLVNARAIVTSSSDEKLARAKTLGASETINYRKIDAWSKRVQDLTHGRGVDLVVEVGGAGTIEQSLRAVRLDGCIALIGVLSGVKKALNLTPILMRNLRIQGILVGNREQFAAMNRAIERAQLRPVVDRVFPFEQAVEALKYLQSGQHQGKVCVNLKTR